MTQPDGIDDRHAGDPGFVRRHASPLAVAIIGGLMLIAMMGLTGGQPAPLHRIEGPAGALDVKMPDRIRTGMVFETAIAVTPHRPFRDLRIGVSPGLWRDITQNTMIPAAAEEAQADGLFTFAYGPRAAGDRLEVKTDLQVNPSLIGRTAGDIVVLDGEVPVLRLPLSLTVLP